MIWSGVCRRRSFDAMSLSILPCPQVGQQSRITTGPLRRAHLKIDALNGREFGRYVQRHTRISRQLVLDLRSVEFFGTAGFTALYYVSVHCTRSDVDWMIVGSDPVRRMLSICDPDGELPLAADLSSALARLDRLGHGLSHVIWTAQAGWHRPARRAGGGQRLHR